MFHTGTIFSKGILNNRKSNITFNSLIRHDNEYNMRVSPSSFELGNTDIISVTIILLSKLI